MRGYAAIGLDNPKNGINVGSALRACGNYGVKLLAQAGNRCRPKLTDTHGVHLQIPYLVVEELHSVIPFNCVPVAVDLIEGAQSIVEYKHPERAFYVFGAEDATLGRRTLSWCRDVIYIPTNGCMNLAATINVVLYSRMLP